MRSCQRWMRSKKIQIKWYHRKIWNNKYFSKFERCRAILMFEKRNNIEGSKPVCLLFIFFFFILMVSGKQSKQASKSRSMKDKNDLYESFCKRYWIYDDSFAESSWFRWIACLTCALGAKKSTIFSILFEG